MSAEDNVLYRTNIKCYIELGFSHKNSKPLDQGQAKVIVIIYIFFYFFEIRKWLRHLHIMAFRNVHKRQTCLPQFHYAEKSV